MDKGISLEFDDDGEADVADDIKAERCFGNVMCRHLKINPMYCTYKKLSAAEFYEKGCPLGYWVKLAVPIGYQNRHREE